MPQFIKQFWPKHSQIPKRILGVAGALVISPIFNILHIFFPYGWSRFQINWIPLVFTPWKMFLLFLPIFVSVGLIYKFRWAFIGWMLYSISLFIYNSYITYYHPIGINFSILTQSFILISLVPWILNKDISSPYFSKDNMRGWRRNLRIPWNKDYISESGIRLKSINRGIKGILFQNPGDSKIQLSQELILFSEFKKSKKTIKGRVTRLTKDQIFISVIEES